MGKTIGYLRVSTIEQDLNKNKAEILALANDKSKRQVKYTYETTRFSIWSFAFHGNSAS